MKKENRKLKEVTNNDVILLEDNPLLFWGDVISIGEKAFKGCTRLKSITIPNKIVGIGSDAFYGCTNLKSVTLPEDTYGISSDTFHNCTSLVDIRLPEKLKRIHECAFEKCTSLEKIELPKGVYLIALNAFKGCTSLEKIELPKGLEDIEPYAFAGCEKLESITIPKGLTSIQRGVFEDCTGLIEVELPDGLTKIERDAFRNCTYLVSVFLPDGLTSVGAGAFMGCTSLSNVLLPQELTNIGSGAFYGVQNIFIHNKKCCGDIVNSEIVKMINSNPNLDLKELNKVYLIAKEKGLDVKNIPEFVALSVNLGILEPDSVKLEMGKDKYGKPNMVPVRDVVFTFVKGLIEHDVVDLNELHSNLQEMHAEGYNEEFLKFVVSKSNFADIKDNLKTLPQMYKKFKQRTNLDGTKTCGDTSSIVKE